MTVYTTGGSESVVSEDGDAADVTYDNTDSGLAATTVQEALDEVAGHTGGVYATDAQEKTSDTALAADDTLVVALEAGKKYAIRAFISTNTNATADLKIDWNYTGTAAAFRHNMWFGTFTAETGGAAATGLHMYNALNSVITFNFTGNNYCNMTFDIAIETTTAGNLEFRWAQNVSNGGATTRLSDSYISVVECA